MHSLSFLFLTAIHLPSFPGHFPDCGLKVKRLTKVFLSTDVSLIPPLAPVFGHAPDEHGKI
jgi:hypothetical protein